MSEELAARIDEARGDVPFEAWARSSFELAIATSSTPHTVSRERALANRRASSDVKRDIGPVQKGGKKK